MERKEYSAGTVKMSFWFIEFRKVVQLLHDGKSMDEIKALAQSENIFAAPTALRSNQIYSTVAGRIKSLNQSFIPFFLSGDLATQKLYALIAAMAYADKADALKLRLLNEMDALDNKLAQQRAAEEARRKAEEVEQSGTSTDEVEIAPAPVKIRKTKNVSIKMMTGTASWRLESKADIDRYIAGLRETLEAQLDEDTIVNVEF